MRFRTTLAATGTACALVGAGAGALLNASAAPTSKPAAAHAARKAKGPLKRAVHIEALVPRKGGLATITIDRGVLKSVSGGQLTIVEASRTVTVDAGSAPVVRLNRRSSTLSALQDGDRVAVIHGPKRVAVRAVRS